MSNEIESLFSDLNKMFKLKESYDKLNKVNAVVSNEEINEAKALIDNEGIFSNVVEFIKKIIKKVLNLIKAIYRYFTKRKHSISDLKEYFEKVDISRFENNSDLRYFVNLLARNNTNVDEFFNKYLKDIYNLVLNMTEELIKFAPTRNTPDVEDDLVFSALKVIIETATIKTKDIGNYLNIKDWKDYISVPVGIDVTNGITVNAITELTRDNLELDTLFNESDNFELKDLPKGPITEKEMADFSLVVYDHLEGISEIMDYFDNILGTYSDLLNRMNNVVNGDFTSNTSNNAWFAYTSRVLELNQDITKEIYKHYNTLNKFFNI